MVEETSIERSSTLIKANIKKISLYDIKLVNLELNYKIIKHINKGAFGKVYKIARLSDMKMFAAKCIPMHMIVADNGFLIKYV